jgi:hypothetical protein
MTQRERHASAGLSATAPAPPPRGAPADPPAPPRPTPPPGTSPPRGSLWEDVFQGASPAQQQELLSLATRQGLLYAHQLPPAGNGTRPHAPAGDDLRGLNLISRLLQGHVSDLEPVRPAPVEPLDTDLDERQREAVARALQTPDICLLQGLPGTGKSRVLAEVVTQAAARGERVLLLAPGAAAIDRVLALVAGREALCPIRCLGQGERPEALPDTARACTFPERVRALREGALAQAVRTREQAEQRCQRLRQEEAVWPRLEALAADDLRLRAEADALAERRERVPAEVGAEAERATAPSAADATAGDDFAAALARAAADHREKAARLEEECARCDQERAERTLAVEELVAQIDSLRPLAAAKSGGRWWSPSWWRATFQGDVPAKLAELDSRREDARAEAERLGREFERLEGECRQAEEAFLAEKCRLTGEETARRQAELDAQLATLRQRREVVAGAWDRTCAELADDPARPQAREPEAVRAARQRWQTRRAEDERGCGFACQWAGYLEQSAESLAARLPGYANLVAATTAALPADEHFGDAGSSGGAFDLLVLDEAEHVTEADLLRLAWRARRWVLAGEPPPAPEAAAPARARGPHRGAPPSAALSRGQVFHRLWQTLHCDPTRLPYAWTREGDSLCCRLRQLAPEQRQWLETERVADRPDVELRILALPRVRPLLAEVVFPAATTVAQAKEYIYRELQELPVQAAERSPRWLEEPDRLVLSLAEAGRAEVDAVALEPGVRELVVTGTERGPWYTSRIEFDRHAGWERALAERWAEAHLRLRDLGRTARLEIPYRMAPALAEAVSDVLFEGAYRVPQPPAGAVVPAGPLVEFVAVPPLPCKAEPAHAGAEREPRRRERGAVATRPEPRAAPPAFPRAGAGLEQDLAVTGHAERLPAEYRAELPRRGLVNYLEAQAVVRRLERLAAGPSAQPNPIAVIALYGPQAVLIRRLVQQSPALAASGLRIEVDGPGAFRQREFGTVLVSLTRSHGHRAVSFGEEPHHLALALTRARARLLVFGDPGTLARRAQWEGVLDHLDEAAAAREAGVIGRLVRDLQGGGRHGRAFRLGEGGGT